MTSTFEAQVAAGARFKFGKNWQAFLVLLTDDRILEAERSLRLALAVESLSGKSFLDIGCGSGLFSLAALRLGAARVHSFDYDPSSVACAQELKRRYAAQAANWTIETGSALDGGYLSHLGQWDVVYSWGVLHHTGALWQALDNVANLVKPGGLLFISIYNDQGALSKFWGRVKALYNRGWLGRWIVSGIFISAYMMTGMVKDIVLYRRNPLRRYRDYRHSRGMSLIHDWIDWLGGYPFEVARPEQIFDFYRSQGFLLKGLKTCGGGQGCNEFVFRKVEGCERDGIGDMSATAACPCRAVD